MIIGKQIIFKAEHYLPGYKGPCSKPHSHDWKLEVAISGDIEPKSGMVIDFLYLEDYIREKIVSQVEHKCINDVLKYIIQPTAENLAMWAWNELKKDLELKYVKVWETEDAWALYQGEITKSNKQ